MFVKKERIIETCPEGSNGPCLDAYIRQLGFCLSERERENWDFETEMLSIYIDIDIERQMKCDARKKKIKWKPSVGFRLEYCFPFSNTCF